MNLRSTGKLFLPSGGSEVSERLGEALQREVRLEDIHRPGEIIVQALYLARHEKDLSDK